MDAMKINGYHPHKSAVYKNFRFITGWLVKGFALFVVIKQEQGRLKRYIMDNNYKQDSGQEMYNLFSMRSELSPSGDEQPESVYF